MNKKGKHKMTIKKDVQCYITKEAQEELNKVVQLQKDQFGSGIHKRDVLSDMIINYTFLMSEYKKLKAEENDSIFDKAEEIAEWLFK